MLSFPSFPFFSTQTKPSDEKKSISGSSLIEETIRIAKQKFVPGYQIAAEMKNKIEELSVDKEMKGAVNIYYNGKEFSVTPSVGSKKIYFPSYAENGKVCAHFGVQFPQAEDTEFTNHATPIKGSNFIAAPGPQYSSDLSNFFTNTVFHKTKPINEVIALGRVLRQDDDDRYERDFYDYFITPRENESVDDFSLTVKKRNVAGKSVKTQSNQILILPGTKTLESTISVTHKDNKEAPRKLHVTMIDLGDNECIDLANDKDNVLKDALWECSKKEEKGDVLVKCAAGIGRTGHLILTLEILKKYKDIFSGNAETAAAKILAIVDRMRENRYCLIASKQQFAGAIRNARILYQYGLKKGFVQTKTKVEKGPAEVKLRCGI
jgi:protein tyrosine phosphatase